MLLLAAIRGSQQSFHELRCFLKLVLPCTKAISCGLCKSVQVSIIKLLQVLSEIPL